MNYYRLIDSCRITQKQTNFIITNAQKTIKKTTNMPEHKPFSLTKATNGAKSAAELAGRIATKKVKH